MPLDHPASFSWADLGDDAQLALSRAALAHAALTIAGQAETLAEEMETGGLEDRGGPDALRLLAAVVRSLNPRGVAGHA